MSGISVAAKTLRMMLAAVLPHASDDDTMPQLMTVRFEVRAGVLYLVATDRYSLAVARFPVPGAAQIPEPDQAVLLPRAYAGQLCEVLAGQEGTCALLIADGRITADCGAVSSSWETSPSANWPDWRSVLAKLLTVDPAAADDTFGMDMRLLARFQIDSRPKTRLVWDDEDEWYEEDTPEWDYQPIRLRVTQPDQPAIVVTRGSWFAGAVVCCRMDGPTATEPQWGSWTEILRETPPEPLRAGPRGEL
jgi:hypothetical protein